MTTKISSMPGATERPKETLPRDIKGLLGKADHLPKDAGHTVSEELSATRRAVSEKACSGENATHEYVRDNPWRIVGIVAKAGIFTGATISRR